MLIISGSIAITIGMILFLVAILLKKRNKGGFLNKDQKNFIPFVKENIVVMIGMFFLIIGVIIIVNLFI